MIRYMLLLNVEVHFLRILVKGMQILVNYPILVTYYMVVILMEVSFRVAKDPSV